MQTKLKVLRKYTHFKIQFSVLDNVGNIQLLYKIFQKADPSISRPPTINFKKFLKTSFTRVRILRKHLRGALKSWSQLTRYCDLVLLFSKFQPDGTIERKY